MTNKQLKELEDNLWESANALRAYGGLKASDYAVPVLGLIFLRFADNKYSQFEPQIIQEYERNKGTRMEQTIEQIALVKCGFYLPDTSRFQHLLDLPEKESMAKALREAMEGIEKHQDAKFQNVLPTESYFDIEKKKKDILPQLLKSFSDIPQDASGDVFGKIYEYFLGKFAMSEGQKGGEFFTPTSVVRFIVEVIEPFSGKIYDPACGSGGMFVQSATFIKNANHDLNDIYVCGQEFMGETVRLAKMNLLVNNLRGEIREVNSYESDPYRSYSKFDYVMANPPFNVKSVKESTVKDDPRFYEYGLPKTKGKKKDNISDANYLWISLFATSLNEKGRAGFVMPNSASDARNAEYEIRKKIVDSGIVDCMVSMPSNMFFTVTLPATLWFFDKEKVHSERKDKILFLDARNVYNQIDRAHREWTAEQQQNLAAIVRLYRGETERYLELISGYLAKAAAAMTAVPQSREALEDKLRSTYQALLDYATRVKDELTPAKKKKLQEIDFFKILGNFEPLKPTVPESPEPLLESPLTETALDNTKQHEASTYTAWQENRERLRLESLKNEMEDLLGLWRIADKNLKIKGDTSWTRNLNRADRAIEGIFAEYSKAVEEFKYWNSNIEWLQKRFPEGRYVDVVGLCKAADRTEVIEEQDYSLNAGRYVGIEIEDDLISEEEFKERIEKKSLEFSKLNNKARQLETEIEEILNRI